MARILASIDLGGTNTACALASADGAMLGERTIPTRPNQCPDAILGRIVATLEAMAEAGAEGRELHLSVRLEGEMMLVEIRDSGPGIRPPSRSDSARNAV